MNASRAVFPKGEVNIVAPLFGSLGGADGFRQLTQDQADRLLRFSREGAISVRVTYAPTRGGIPPPGMVAQGISGKLEVMPATIKNDPGYREEDDRFSVPLGTFPVSAFVKTEAIKQAGHSYCLAYFRYDARLSPVVSSYAKDALQIGQRRKGRMLLKHDPFADKWAFVAADYANEEEGDFTTDNVATALLRQGSAPSPRDGLSPPGGAAVAPAPTARGVPSFPPGPIPNQTASGGVHKDIARVFFAAGGDKLGEYQLGGTVVVSKYVLQPWITKNTAGEAVFEFVGPPTYWTLRTMGGGQTDVGALVAMAIPKEIADQLVAGLGRGR